MPEQIRTPSTMLEVEDCTVCGVWFALPSKVLKERQTKGGSFYCPNGHSLVYRTPEVERQRKQIDRLRSQVVHEQDQREAAERSAAAYKGHLTKLRKRIDQGVCPHCKRNFPNVMRHMASQHPDKVAEAREALANDA